MKRSTITVVFLALLVILFGCARGQVSTLPKISEPEKAVTLTLIRERIFFGGGVSFLVAMDEQNIAMLENGSHISFKAEPGAHVLSYAIWRLYHGGWNVRDRIEINCIPGEQYFLKFATDDDIRLITREEAAPLIADTKNLPLEQ